MYQHSSSTQKAQEGGAAIMSIDIWESEGLENLSNMSKIPKWEN